MDMNVALISQQTKIIQSEKLYNLGIP